MKTLSHELSSQYNLSIKKYSYNRSNYYLHTDKGEFVLRKISIPKEQIMFVYEAINHLKMNSFLEVSLIYPTKKNLPYSIYKGQMYVMQSHIEGEEVDYKNKEDVIGVVELLAKFHQSGVNFSALQREPSQIQMKNIYEHFSRRYRESHTIKKKIANLSQKAPFEIMFLKDYRVYEELEKMALRCIDLASCNKIIEEAQRGKTLVHNDYKYHAISKTKDTYHLVHLDNCTYNIQVLDLNSVLTKIMQKNNWDVGLLKELMLVYEAVKPLTLEEKSVLKAMLIFPEKYATICHKYLQSRRRNHYSMFEVKWANMLEYQHEQVEAAKYIELEL